MIQELRQLREHFLLERIDAAYSEFGERPLTPAETTQLVDQAVNEVEAATWASKEETEQLAAQAVEEVEAATWPSQQAAQQLQGRAQQW